MKKKMLGIVVSVFAMALILTAVGFGTWTYLRNKNVEETGNVLGVSWYNETDIEFTITTKEELFEFAKLSDYYDFKNQTIKLGADIVINEGNAEDWAEKAPKTRWTPISGFAGRFDGQGHKISGLYAKGHETPTALFVNADYSCSIKNVSLVNSLFKTSGNAGVASFLSNGGGKLSGLYSDAIFVHKGEKVGGIVSDITAQSTLEECWFDGSIEATSRNIGGIVDHVSDGARVTIKHCLFSGDINQKYEFNGTRTGGIVGRVAGAATVVINDSLTTGTIKTGIESEIGAMIGKSESGVNVTIADSYTSKDTHSAVVGSKSGTYSGVGIGLYGQYLIGTKAYQWTTLDFDKYWVAIEGETPILKYFAKDVTPLSVEGLAKEFDTSWYNEYTSKFELTTREQMYGFYYLSMTNTFAGQTVALGNDIVINEGKATKWEKSTPDYLWYPIHQFAGTFDGQGHTISGLCLKEDGAYQGYNGLFGRADQGSTIKNLLIKNSYFERMFEKMQQAAFLGSVAGETRGTIDSVYSDAIIKSNGIQVGGIVGRMNYMDSNYQATVSVNNCWFDGEITGIMNQKMGGIVSYVGRGSKILAEGTKLAIIHCLNTGTINNARTSNKEGFNGAAYTGGILGFDNSAVNLTMEDCLNAGELNLGYKGYAGSITGRIAKKGSIYTIKDTYTTWESLTYNSDLPLAVHDITGTMIGGPANVPAEQLTGLNAYKYSTLDFKNYWSVVDGSTPVLKTFAGKVGVKTQSTSGAAKKVDMSWYKANKDTYVLDSMEDLYGFYVMSTYEDFAGKTIKLGADITFNSGNAADWKTNAPENEWYPIGVNRTNYRFAGTFDGQGHTISGLYLSDNSEWVNYSGFFGVTATGSVVKNLKITNSYFERLNKASKSAMMGSVAGEVQGTIQNVYSDAIIYTDGNQVGGIAGRMVYADKEGKTTTMVDSCWFDGVISGTMNQKMGGIVAYAGRSGAKAEISKMQISNCLFTGTVGNDRTTSKDGIGGQYIGGIFGYDIAAVNMKIDNCLSAGTIDVVYNGYVGSVIGIIDKSTSVFTITNTYGTDECFHISDGTPRAIHVVDGTMIGGAATIPEAMVTDTKAYQFTSLDFAKTWAVTEWGTPELKYFSGEGKSVAGYTQLPDVSWYDTDKDTYILEDAGDLYGFREVSTYTNFKGKTVKLGKDITVNSGTVDGTTTPVYDGWSPIGIRYKFAGIFDGQGHTISGLSIKAINDSYLYTGLFGWTDVGSNLKNFSLKNTYVERMVDTDGKQGTAMVGSIAGEIRGSMDSVYSNAIVSTDGHQAGGLVGRLNYLDATGKTALNVNNCWFDGKLLGTSSIRMGGIAGYVGKGSAVKTEQTDINITNCLNSGYITNTRVKKADEIDGGQYIGGLLGFDNAGVNVNLIGCVNAGEIDLTYQVYASSIVGRIQKTGSTFVMDNCYAINERFMLSSGVTRVTHEPAGTLLSDTVLMPEELMTGYKAYQFTELDFDKYWAVVDGDTPVLQTFADKDPSVKDYKKMVDRSWYDADEEKVYIDSVQDLYGFFEISTYEDFAGQIVFLDEDIKINDGDALKWDDDANAPEYGWYPIGYGTIPFAGDFDGQGHTITGLYMKDDREVGTTYTGFFGITEQGTTVSDLMLTNSYIEYNGSSATNVGSIVGELRGNLDTVYSDAIVVNNMVRTGGLAGRASYHDADLKETVNINNCWFAGEVRGGSTGTDMGGLIGVVMKSEVDDIPTMNITNCLFTGKITSTRSSDSTLQYAGGIVARDNASAVKVNITDCVSAGKIDVQCHDGVGSIVAAARNKNAKFVITDTYATSEGYQENGTVVTADAPSGASGKIEDGAVVVNNADLVNYNPYAATKLDFENYWIARSEDMVALKSFVDTSDTLSVDTSWYTDETYTIKNIEQWYGFNYLFVRGKSFEGITVKLGANLKLNEGDAKDWTDSTKAPVNRWYPIGSNVTSAAGTGAFPGNFDGQGYTISGLYIKNTSGENNTGIFRNTQVGSVIKNFQLVNSYVESNGGRVGSIVGDMRGTLSNVYSDAIVTGETGAQVGGLVGTFNVQTGQGATEGTIEKCWFNGTVDISGANAQQIGGITGAILKGGSANGNFYITDCLVTGTIKSSTTKADDPAYVGGIWGDNSGGSKQYVYVTDCLMAGTIEATGNTSGVATLGGAFRNTGSYCYFEDTYAVIGNNPQVTVARNIIDPGDQSTKNEGKLNYQNYAGVETTTTAPLANIFLTKDDMSSYNTFFTLGFDFTNTWVARKTDVPVLKNYADSSETIALDTSFMTDGTYTIDNLAELYGFAYLSYTSEDLGAVYKGKTIKLGADITVNEGNAADWADPTKAPINKWYPIGSSATNAAGAGAFDGEFDGQGHTISGFYIKHIGAESNTGMFRNVQKESTVKDFQLINSYVESNGNRAGSVVGDLRGTLSGVYSDAIVVTSAVQAGGLVGIANYQDSSNKTTVNIEKCWFAGTVTGGEASNQLGGIIGSAGRGAGTAKIYITDSLFTGTITGRNTGSYQYTGGFVGDTNKASNMNLYITNCLMAGEIDVTNTNGVASMVGAFRHKGGKCYIENSYAIDTYVVDSANLAVDQAITGQADTGTVNYVNYAGVDTTTTAPLTSIFFAKEDLMGYNAFFELGLDFANTWTGRKSDVPTLKTFVDTKEQKKVVPTNEVIAIDTSFMTDGTYTINNLNELYGFAYLSYTSEDLGAVYDGNTIKLGADIVVNEGNAADWTTTAPVNKWYPIGSNATNAAGAGAFAGTFDGQGHTISGLYIKNESGENCTGIFRNAQGGSVVKNFQLVNSYVESNGGRTGSVVGDLRGTLSNVYSNAIVTGNTGAQVGGLVGTFNVQTGQGVTSGTIEKCWFDGTVSVSGANAQQIGGIAGAILKGSSKNGYFYITDCLMTGTVKSTSTKADDPVYLGGIWGDNSGGSKQYVYVTNCLMAGTIEVTGNTAGVASLGGAFRNTGSYCYFENTYAITGTNPQVTVARDIQDPDGSGKKNEGKLNYQNYAGVATTTTAPIASIFFDKAEISGNGATSKIPGLFGTDSAWEVDNITNGVPILKVFKTFWTQKSAQ